MVSDGMSNGVLTMAEDFSNLSRGKGTNWLKLVSNPEATNGLMETSSADSFVTDSAAAGSAWGGGAKINNGSINVRPDGSESVPIMRSLKKLGHNTGLVSTTRITHATPATFATVTPERNDEHLIAPQYLGHADILLGGGLKFFSPKQREDGHDAISPYRKAGYDLLLDRDSLLESKNKKLLGLFSDGHIPYDIDRINNPELKRKTPTLAEMSEAALSRFLADDKKFLLQIEGGRIDHAAHANDIAALLRDQLAFDDAVGKVLEMTSAREDILVIVTSDHGNANPGLNGTGMRYRKSNQAFARVEKITSSHEVLLQQWRKSASKNLASLQAIVREGLGIKLSKPEAEALLQSITGGDAPVWSDQLSNPYGLLGQFTGNHTGTGFTGTSHTSDPTFLSAIGPQSSRFSGITPNQEVYRHLIELLG